MFKMHRKKGLVRNSITYYIDWYLGPRKVWLCVHGLICFAVCLDGSPPAYHLDRGFGTGIKSWLIQLEVCSVVSLNIYKDEGKDKGKLQQWKIEEYKLG